MLNQTLQLIKGNWFVCLKNEEKNLSTSMISEVVILKIFAMKYHAISELTFFNAYNLAAMYRD